MKKSYLKNLIENCDCLSGYTPEKLEEDLKKYNLEELTGNLWEDVPYINKELPFAKKSASVREQVQYERGGYGFRDYFDCDCDDLCHGSDEGVCVYEIFEGGAYFACQVSGKSVKDIEDMTDDEFGQFLDENGIF